MKSRHPRSIMLTALLVIATTAVSIAIAGCGGGDPYVGSWGAGSLLQIEKNGDTYLVSDIANPWAKEYEAAMENGKLVAKTKLATYTFTVDGNWIAKEGGGLTINYERN